METVRGAQQSRGRRPGPRTRSWPPPWRRCGTSWPSWPGSRPTRGRRPPCANARPSWKKWSAGAAGTPGWRPRRLAGPSGAAELTEALGHRLLVEYAPVGRHLVAVVLDRGRCRLFELAPLADVREAVAGLRLALRTALDADPPAEDRRPCGEAGADVQRLVLAPSAYRPAGRWSSSPTGPCLPTPWALLPDLATAHGGGGGVGAEPSARRRHVHARRGRAKVVALAGPGLQPRRDEEAEAVAELWAGPAGSWRPRSGRRRGARGHEPAPTSSTSPRTAPYRADNPLLSAIRLARRPPHGPRARPSHQDGQVGRPVVLRQRDGRRQRDRPQPAPDRCRCHAPSWPA